MSPKCLFLLSTFPLSFFFFDFSKGKISIFKREWKRGKPFFSHNFWMQKNRFVSIMLTTDFSVGCPHFHSLFFSMPKNDEKKKRVEMWRTILSNKTAFFKIVLWAWCSQPLFHFSTNFFEIFRFSQFSDLEISKNGKKFLQKNAFFWLLLRCSELFFRF